MDIALYWMLRSENAQRMITSKVVYQIKFDLNALNK